MILVNVVAFILNTDEDIAQGWVQILLNVIEYISVGFFTMEYLLRFVYTKFPTYFKDFGVLQIESDIETKLGLVD